MGVDWVGENVPVKIEKHTIKKNKILKKLIGVLFLSLKNKDFK